MDFYISNPEIVLPGDTDCRRFGIGCNPSPPPVEQPVPPDPVADEGEILIENDFVGDWYERLRPIFDRFGLDVHRNGYTSQELLQAMEDVKQLPVSSGNLFIHRIQKNTDGSRVVVGAIVTDSGTVSHQLGVVRYRADGTLDPQSLRLLSAPGPLVPLGVQVNEQGDTFLGVSFGGRLGILKFDPSGELDRSFGAQGMIVTAFAPGPDYLQGMTLQSDGKIVLTSFRSGGNARMIGERETFIRFQSNGEIDRSFGDMGLLIVATYIKDTHWPNHVFAGPVDGAALGFSRPYLVTRDSAPERLVPSQRVPNSVTETLPRNSANLADTLTVVAAGVHLVAVPSTPDTVSPKMDSVAGLVAASGSRPTAPSPDRGVDNAGDADRIKDVSSGVSHTEGVLSRAARARRTFSRRGAACLVQMRGLA